MKIIFAGTPQAALPSLTALVEDPTIELCAVLTQPDKKQGRGRKNSVGPIAQYAREHDIPLLQPHSIRDDEVYQALADLKPDCCPIVAYGALLPADILKLPPLGWINVHFSLLPLWRGASPVHSSIAAGDDITGVSTFLLDEGMDTGPVLGTVTTEISSTDTTGTLTERLANMGATLLVDTLHAWEKGLLSPQPQDHSAATYTSKITTENARIQWNRPEHCLDRHIRAMAPHPGAWTMRGDTRLKIGACEPVSPGEQATLSSLSPGELLFTGKKLYVGTAYQPLRLTHIQAPGKKMMAAADWARGAHLNEGEALL